MRPIERRIEALENKAQPTKNQSLLVFREPDGADPDEFERECRAAAGDRQMIVIRFVRPGEARGS